MIKRLLKTTAFMLLFTIGLTFHDAIVQSHLKAGVLHFSLTFLANTWMMFCGYWAIKSCFYKKVYVLESDIDRLSHTQRNREVSEV